MYIYIYIYICACVRYEIYPLSFSFDLRCQSGIYICQTKASNMKNIGTPGELYSYIVLHHMHNHCKNYYYIYQHLILYIVICKTISSNNLTDVSELASHVHWIQPHQCRFSQDSYKEIAIPISLLQINLRANTYRQLQLYTCIYIIYTQLHIIILQHYA